jgi:hypothetical protein
MNICEDCIFNDGGLCMYQQEAFVMQDEDDEAIFCATKIEI